MIKTDSAYETAISRLKMDREHLDRKRQDLANEGLNPSQVENVLEAESSFHLQLREEVEWYERVRRGDLEEARRLTDIGRTLIALRIAAGCSQRDLAQALKVDESQVSRDERNEYYHVTLQKAQQVIDALHGKIRIMVTPPAEECELQPA